MSHENIIRAWKDEAFRNSLSEEERALLPDHPVGSIELTDTDLKAVAAAAGVPATHSKTGCPTPTPITQNCTNIVWACTLN
jgi:mersacidin/lichenicidin family type 2 lantibiotic